MKSKRHIVIFSHGFGVRRDARGLFTDIVEAFRNGDVDIDVELFDYTIFNEEENTITVPPLSRQAEVLQSKVEEVRRVYPDATIDIVCHSQGAVAAGLISMEGMHIRKMIFIAPPVTLDFTRMLSAFQSREGTIIDMDGMSRLARRDGSFTLVPSMYFKERKNIQPMELFVSVSQKTDLLIVVAKQDEVLGETRLSFSKVLRVVELEGNHDFSKEYRADLLRIVVSEIV